MDLLRKRCVPCEGGVPPLGKSEVRKLMPKVKGWSIDYYFISFHEKWSTKSI